jgi:hypothetical protein
MNRAPAAAEKNTSIVAGNELAMSSSAENSSPVLAVEEAINRFVADVTSGKNWYLTLLESVKNWPVSEETIGDQRYQYLISGEALDLLQIAERLIKAAGHLVPEDETVDFLFHNKPPAALTQEETRKAMGDARFAQYLNFFYGITAEEALLQAVEDEVRKEEQGLNVHTEAQIIDETYRRVYDVPQRVLLRQFRKERAYASGGTVTLEKMKEFSYWRFKYRLKHCDKARIASDTKKALNWMKRNSGF